MISRARPTHISSFVHSQPVPVRAASARPPKAGTPPDPEGLTKLLRTMQARKAKGGKIIDPRSFPVAMVSVGEFGIPMMQAMAEQGKFPILGYSRSQETADYMRRHGCHPEKHTNLQFLPEGQPGKVLPVKHATEKVSAVNGIDYTHELGRVVRESKGIFLSVPGRGVHSTIEALKAAGLPEDVYLITLMKTFVGARVSRLLREAFPNNPVVYLGGLSSDDGLVKREVTELGVASDNIEHAKYIAQLINQHIGRFDITPYQYVRVNVHPDPVGLELGGIFKNVIAIAAGACVGLGYDNWNALGTLVELGKLETKRFIELAGGSPDSMRHRAVAADYYGTCLGNFSRNKEFGVYYGEYWREHGKAPTTAELDVRFKGRTVEGRTTLEFLMAALEGIPTPFQIFPVIVGTHELIFNGANPQILKDLLLPMTEEGIGQDLWEKIRTNGKYKLKF